MAKCLEINLFGACFVKSTRAKAYEIKGSKHKALFVLLATAPFGRRTRTYLQDTLWGRSCYDTGRQSLRRALSDIKKIMGSDFEKLIVSTNSDITLNLSGIHFSGVPGGSEFLEGMDIKENRFEDWLRSIRQDPGQVFSLYSHSSQKPAPSSVPTLAIVPFRLVQGGNEHAILGDWLAEEVCRSLSRSNLLSVISHLSSRAMCQRKIEIETIRTDLKVDYCVTGCLRVVGDMAILDADFLDTHSGRILWTRNFSCKVGDLLDSDSEAINEIVLSVGRMIASESIRHVAGRSLSELSGHQLLVAGVSLMHELRLTSFAKSRELLFEASRRAPNAAEPYSWLAEWHVMSIFNDWSTDRIWDVEKATEFAATALDIDPENAFCLTIEGVVAGHLHQNHEVATGKFEAALSRNPNESLSWLFSSTLHAYQGDAESALSNVERANRLSPLDPMGYFFDCFTASAHLSAGNFETALEFSERSLAKNERHLSTHRARICALHHLGRTEEAREGAAELMRRQPNFTVKKYQRDHPAKDGNFGQIHAQALLTAGVPKGV